MVTVECREKVSDLLFLSNSVFGNLIYNAHFKWEASEPEAVKAAIGQAIQRYSTTRESQKATWVGSQYTSNTGQLRGTNNHDNSFNNSQNTNNGQNSLAGSNNFNFQGQEEPHQARSPHQDEQRQGSGRSDSRIRSGPSGEEIMLTRSELEKCNTASLRRGESLRRYSASGQSTPLPRSLFSSSVSTQMHSNIFESGESQANPMGRSSSCTETYMNPWAPVNLSTASESAINPGSGAIDGCIGEEEEYEENRCILQLALMSPASDLLKTEYEYWGGIDASRRCIQVPLPDKKGDNIDEVQGAASGKQSMQDHSRKSTASITSRSSRLAPSNLPQDGPEHLSYAASRVQDVRSRQEQAMMEREATADVDSKGTRGSSIVTGSESFHDETSLERSMEGGRRRRSSPRRSPASAARIVPPLHVSSPPLHVSSTSQNHKHDVPPLQRTSSDTSASSEKRRQKSSSKRRQPSRSDRRTSSEVPKTKKPSVIGGSQMDVSDQALYFS
jgi:hypothetical protein